MALETLSAHTASSTGEEPERLPKHAANPSQAKTYSKTKLSLGLISSIVSFAFLVVYTFTGYSRVVADFSHAVSPNEYLALMVFVLCTGSLHSGITLPLGFYSGYIIEHKYGLSTQTIGTWAREKLKGVMVGAPLMLLMILALYYSLSVYHELWWLPVGIVLTLFSVLLARLAPVLIFPLFYKFIPIPDGILKERLLELCRKVGVKIEGIYSFNMSKNTRKANAALAGIGGARRIILGDTLLREFTEDEIVAVFAHEVGHHKHKHILTGILTGTITTFGGLYVASLLFGWSVAELGFGGLTDLAALPLLAIWLALFGLIASPLGNALSRRNERQADAYAVRTTRNAQAFVSALRKLARSNLADPDPHPIIEFMFYSHPSIGRRVRAAETMMV